MKTGSVGRAGPPADEQGMAHRPVLLRVSERHKTRCPRPLSPGLSRALAPKRTFDRFSLVPDQRDRILEVTLGLMARAGARGTSMRAVAAACGLNVATLYHYFPSKRELLQAAISSRRTTDLPNYPFPEGLAGSVAERLGALLDHLFVGMTADEDLWRTLLSE